MFQVKRLKQAMMFLGLLAGASHAPAAILVTEWSLFTQARDTFPVPWVSVEQETVAFPFQQTDTAVDGPTWAQSSYDFGVGEDWAAFDFGFEHHRSGTQYSRTESIGWVDFVLEEPLEYSLAGWFALSGTGRIRLDVSLVDSSVYGGRTVYAGGHESHLTPDESFTLGVPGGDTYSTEIGTLSGTLEPGVPYHLYYYYLIENYPTESTSPAAALGGLSFTLVPEPCTAALLGIGVVILLKRDRRARR